MDETVNLLAFDIGAESGRAILGRLINGRIVTEEIHRFANSPIAKGDHLYTDIHSIWREMVTGLHLAGESCGAHLASIGVDTWGVDFVLLDRSGQLIDTPRHYRDRRTRGMMQKALQLIPGLDFYTQTGNQFMEFNSVFQLMAIKETDPDQLDRAENFLMLPDLLHYWLSGQKQNEFTNATTTQCFDQRRGSWADTLLEKLEIPRHIFGQVAQPAACCGTLVKTLVDDTGLSSAQVVLPGSHDTASAIAAIPASDPDYLYISSGTWSLVGVELAEPEISYDSYKYNLTNEGIPGGRTSFLQLVNGLWFLQQCQLDWNRQGRTYSYEELTRLGRDAGDDGSFIDVSNGCFLDPGDIPERIRTYCRITGQVEPASDGEIVRCIVESLACKYRALLETYQTILHKKLPVIHIIGGGSRNDLLNQLTANIAGLPVIAGPVETTALGNLLVQAMGLGVFSDLTEIRQVVARSFEVRVFKPDQSCQWNDRYEQYQKMIRRVSVGSTL